MNRNTLELIVSLVLIGVGCTALGTIGLSEDSASPFLLSQERSLGGLDYRTFPRIYAVILIILSLVNVLILLKSRYRADDGVKFSPEKRRHIFILTIATAVLTLIYTIILPYVNFIAATFIFLIVMFWIYGQRRIFLNIIVSAGCSAVFWIVFVKLSHLTI